MCTVLLPPGDNTIAVNKYININIVVEFFASGRRALGDFCFVKSTSIIINVLTQKVDKILKAVYPFETSVDSVLPQKNDIVLSRF